MRLLVSSIGRYGIVAASLVVFWPLQQVALGSAILAAQEPSAADPFAAPPGASRIPTPAGVDPFGAPARTPRIVPPPTSAAGRDPRRAPAGPRMPTTSRIEYELQQPTELDVVEMPLKDVVAFLSEKHSIPIVLSMKRLEEASVAADTPITKSLRGIRLKSALHLMLKDLELSYVVRDEVLQITTPEDARSRTEIRIYDCRDILAMPATHGGNQVALDTAIAGARVQQLMTLVKTNVEPQTWRGATDAAEVPGAVSEYNGLLVITHNAETHESIQHVFDMLRAAAGLKSPEAGRVVP